MSRLGLHFARRSLLTLAVALAVTLPAFAAGPLTWTFEKGKVLKYDFVQKNSIKATVEGQEQGNDSTLDVDLTWTVDSVSPEGVASITQTIDHARVTLKVMGQDLVYDSKEKKAEDPAIAPIAKIYDSVIGEKYTLKISKRGEILEVTVPDKVSASIKGTPFEMLADSGSLLSSKGIKAMMMQVLPTLPAKEVEKGGTWTGTVDLPAGPLSMTLDSTYTLTDLADGVATIVGKIDIKLKAKEDAKPKVTVEKQTGESKYVIDSKAGVMSSSAIKQSFELVIMNENQKFVQAMTIDATMKLIK